MKFTAQNSKTLSAQLDRYNSVSHYMAGLNVNWGREGKRGTWFAQRIFQDGASAYHADLKTGLTFDEVVAYVQGQADAALEAAAWIAREEATT